MTTLLGFHSTKGGVGTTLLAAHTCALAKELGHRVVGLTFDPTHELPKWLNLLEIPCLDGLKVEALPADVDLVVIDWNTHIDAVPVDLDLLVIPIDCALSVEHALTLSDRVAGRVVWFENHPHGHPMIPAITLPPYLNHVAVVAGVRGVARSRAIRDASDARRIVWSTEDGAGSPGGRNLRSALLNVLRRAIEPEATQPSSASTERCDSFRLCTNCDSAPDGASSNALGPQIT